MDFINANQNALHNMCFTDESMFFNEQYCGHWNDQNCDFLGKVICSIYRKLTFGLLF